MYFPVNLISPDGGNIVFWLQHSPVFDITVLTRRTDITSDLVGNAPASIHTVNKKDDDQRTNPLRGQDIPTYFNRK